MKKLIIGKNIAYAKTTVGATNTAVTPDLLADGSIGVYGFDPITNKPALIVASSVTEVAGLIRASNFKGNSIQIFQGTSNGIENQLGTFDTKGSKKLLYSPYSAASPTVLYAGYNEVSGNLILTPVATNKANQASIKVIERTKGNNERFYTYYTVPVSLTDTPLLIATALAAKINTAIGDNNLFTATVVNSGVNYGVKLISKTIGRSFSLIVTESLETSPTTVVGGSIGSGTPSIILDLEKESDIRSGLNVQDIFDKQFTSSVDKSKTYEVYELDVVNATNDSFSGGRKGMEENVQSFIALEVQGSVIGTNQKADLLSIFTGFGATV